LPSALQRVWSVAPVDAEQGVPKASVGILRSEGNVLHVTAQLVADGSHGSALMVELILSEPQLACLKAAVTIGSEESAALGRSVRFGNKVLSPEPFAVRCTREIANRLLTVAKRSCPDVVPEIRAAIEQDRATEAT
jgi:hypothetical protein